MNTPSPAGAQDRTSSIIYGVVGSLIATALVAAGVWLAGQQVPDETVLQSFYSESKVGRLASWYIRITNNSEVAFDLQLTPPSVGLVRYEYVPKGAGSPSWRGQIPRGETVEALYVYEEPNATLSAAVIQSLAVATYQERNPYSGTMEARTGEIRDVGVLPLVRTVLLVFWFLLPTLVASALFFASKGLKWVAKWFR